MRLISLATLVAALAGPATAEDVQTVASDAVGVLCVPLMISGRLTSDDLIADSGFVPGTQAHPEVLSTPSFRNELENGDVVEVFADIAQRRCTVHIHGAEAVKDAYLAAIRAQRWGQMGDPQRLDTGATMSLWRVNFARGAGGAMQVLVVAPPGITDPAKPQVIAIIGATD